MKILKSGIENQEAINLFDKVLFWDCNADSIMLEEDFDIVIERVLSHSLYHDRDLPILNKIYPLKLIKKIALPNTQIFGNERILAIADYFGFNPEDFYRWIYFDDKGNVDLKKNEINLK